MRVAWMGIAWLGVGAQWVLADDWPQWRGPQRDGVWRESGIVAKLPEKLTTQWKTKIGAGYAGPAVVGDRVYVTDRQLGQGQRNPDNPFDAKTPVGGSERILCLNAKTGAEIWKHEYPCRYTVSYGAGPRVTPTVVDGKLYTVGAMGDFFCLDADTGKVIWSKHYVKDYGAEINIWGCSAHPLVDGKKLILLIGGGNRAGVVALDKETGQELWRALELRDPGYCPPMIIQAGGVRQLIIWSPVALSSLDPETGKTYWQQPFELRSALSIPQPVFAKDQLFVTAFYNGPMMMTLAQDKPTATVAWKGNSSDERNTDGLHAIMCTPVLKDGFLYGVCSYGQLRCLDAKTGQRLWETTKPTGKDRWWNAFIVAHEDRYFLANEQGELITAKLSPEGYQEESRAFLIAPTGKAMRRKIVWSHPAFANQAVYARNDNEIVCVDLSAKQPITVVVYGLADFAVGANGFCTIKGLQRRCGATNRVLRS